MKIFLAGASGAIGRRLTPLLMADGHEVTGTTRTPKGARELEAAGVRPEVVDVFDAAALKRAVIEVAAGRRHPPVDRPAARIRRGADGGRLARATPASASKARTTWSPPRRRHRRTASSCRASPLPTRPAASRMRRPIRSISRWAAGRDARRRRDDGASRCSACRRRMPSCCATAGSTAPGPGPSSRPKAGMPARRCRRLCRLLAVTRGEPGIYNIAEDDGAVRIGKARRELGFDPAFRLSATA